METIVAANRACSKWFSGQSTDRKPEPQQTKLKLQSNPTQPQKSSRDTNGLSNASVKSEIEDDSKDIEETSEDVDMHDAESVNGQEDDDSPRDRKRRRTSNDDVEPQKRTSKTSTQYQSTKVKNGTSKTSSSAVDEDEEDSLPVRPSRRTATKKEDKSVDESSHKGAVKAPVVAAPDIEAKSDQEPEEVDEEEEEKPEEAAKARKSVLLALKGSGKDPYPDWKAGEPVPYAALCTTFHKIEMTTKRLEILAHCSLFLRQVLRLTPDDLLETVLLMINKLGADYTGVELGIGESLIMKAIGESTGRSLAVIKADQNEIGDLGMVAAKSRSNQPTMFKPKPLTVRGVFSGLKDIAVVEGQGSQGRKVAGIKKLLSAADAASSGKGGKGVDITNEKGGPSEAKYIVRTLEGKLRLGLAEKSVLVALAQAVVFHRTEYLAAVEGKKVKPPTEEELAKGEATLKSVYR
jgi:DNA ligase 1